MTTPTEPGPDRFDERIALASPPITPATPEVDDQLLAMIAAARQEAAPAARSAKPRRLAWMDADS